ncbi:hypothetical protein OJAV_G00039270 [Oryzias javanicus]|uniref:Protein SSUH2 homolog n=1 Tax=Oryzias javanicus TaxID=123683 RepID=A0A3S2PDB9_ORYJA|nr:hypothetical protein OJAV_G00039270 [Oryzias javanicus]
MNPAGVYPPPTTPAPNAFGNQPAYAAPGVYPPPTAPAPNAFGNQPAYAAPAMHHPLNAAVPTMPMGVPGYEGMGSGGFVPPPAPTQPAPAPPGPVPENWSIPSLTEEEAREALENFVSEQCCYGSDPVKEAVITNMEPCNTFRYRLETFTESRNAEQAQKPHEGEVADFYTQPAPQPWEVQATPTKLFTDEIKEIRVPFTSTVQDCNNCQAKGKISCKKCNGKGKSVCSLCNGNGRRDDGDCPKCSASGKERCGICDGTGKKECKTCDGKCRLLSYIKLKVEWTNHVDSQMVQDQSGLKPDCLQSVTGKELFQNSGFMVYPLLGFPNPAISDTSERLIRESQSKFAQNSRILQQRQTVELIPVTKVKYQWKSNDCSFSVYGSERKVQADDYPDTCACCVIL